MAPSVEFLSLAAAADIGESLSDATALLRIQSWIVGGIQKIWREKGIKGMRGLCDTAFIIGQNRALIDCSTVSPSAIMEEVYKCVLNISGARTPLYSIPFMDYLDKRMVSDNTGTPQWFTVHDRSDYDQYIYLYPRPSEACTVEVYGKINIIVYSPTDIVYPIGCEDVLADYVRWQNNLFHQNEYLAMMCEKTYLRSLKMFRASASSDRVYVLGGGTTEERKLNYPEPIVMPP